MAFPIEVTDCKARPIPEVVFFTGTPQDSNFVAGFANKETPFVTALKGCTSVTEDKIETLMDETRASVAADTKWGDTKIDEHSLELRSKKGPVHCEVAIIQYLVNERLSSKALVKPDIGISKLSCLACFEFFQAVEEVSTSTTSKPSLPIVLRTRGCHGGILVPYAEPQLNVPWANEVGKNYEGRLLRRVVEVFDKPSIGHKRTESSSTNRSERSDDGAIDISAAVRKIQRTQGGNNNAGATPGNS